MSNATPRELHFALLLVLAISTTPLLSQQIDFEDPAFFPGDSVGGLGTLHPWLNIASPNGPVLTGSPDDAYPEVAVAYRSPAEKVVLGGNSNLGYWPNGCIGAPGLYLELGDTALLATGHGVRDPNPGPNLWYDFTFGGRTVGYFSVDLLDYGDYFPYGPGFTMTHTVQLIAYDESGTALDLDTLTFSSTGTGLIGRTLIWQGSDFDSALLGDACTAQSGQPGYRTFVVMSPGIYRVELFFDGPASVDPGHALDNVDFTLDVRIDFKPGSGQNPFNAKSNGTLPVAILGGDGFDVSEIDTSSLRLGALTVKVKKNGTLQCSYADVSGDYTTSLEGGPDGRVDLLCHFQQEDSDSVSDSDTLELTGNLLDGTPIQGTEPIRVVPARK